MEVSGREGGRGGGGKGRKLPSEGFNTPSTLRQHLEALKEKGNEEEGGEGKRGGGKGSEREGEKGRRQRSLNSFSGRIGMFGSELINTPIAAASANTLKLCYTQCACVQNEKLKSLTGIFDSHEVKFSEFSGFSIFGDLKFRSL
jgi:hypothetical protein